ncbi:T9SS type A sorting domain-containing protein [Rhodohalobacter sp.]|uniref:T9SS type A sorting domain-containing protein n=1 Tax=Rhodohalobacter sp. TaxID=1974210 RepID=UPI002ACECB39|nr:T9SS type A sorting domain-containing protein [Rhodohalobacter sp.]MDZ7755712.1 T9SS type A sorting domain-containing protein [Rhodohalobacter sp.]
MRYSKYLILLFLLIGLNVVSVDSLAQTVQHPVFRELDEALNRGEISRETALIEKLRFTYRSGESHQQLHAEAEHAPIKCTVPLHAEFLHLKDQLPATTIAEIEPYFERPETSHLEEYLSASGNFVLYYETEGENAVPAESTIEPGIPDYIYLAAESADSSYRYQIEELGFVDFLRSEPYEIYFEDIIFYGTTTSSGSSSFITINNNFENFPENAHPDGDVIGALYATIAHEIKHAVQYATNGWDGSAGSFDWIEMDATLMEEIVYPDVDDYYNYIKEDFESDEPNSLSIFGAPGSATPGAYWHMTWMLYFAEQYGMEFWVDVWEQFIEDRTKSFFDAVDESLIDQGRTLERDHLNNMLWHIASGPIYSAFDFGFEDRENYPTPNFSNNLGIAPGQTNGFTLRSMAAHFIEASPSNVALGQPQFTLESDATGIGLGVIGYFRDGSTDVQLALQSDSEIQSLQTTWAWEDLTDITIAVVNTNRTGTANYLLNVSSVLPEEDLVAQNFPNPFNPSTKIEYAITETQPVKIEVFDVVGRKIQTLVDGDHSAGFYSVDFDGSGLASGMYIYRITTDQTVMDKKMLLIK